MMRVLVTFLIMAFLWFGINLIINFTTSHIPKKFQEITGLFLTILFVFSVFIVLLLV